MPLPIPDNSDALLTRDAVALALTEAGFPVRAKTLATKATRGGGPPFRSFGRRPLYRWADASNGQTRGSPTPQPIPPRPTRCTTMKLDLSGARDAAAPVRWGNTEEVARELWSARQCPRGSPVDTYLHEYCLYRGPIPHTIAYLAPNRLVGHPAMIAAFWTGSDDADFEAVNDDRLDAVRLTLLREDGLGRAGTICDRINVGYRPERSVIVLGALHGGDVLGFSLDIEHGLLLHQYSARPVWCFLDGRPHSIPMHVKRAFVPSSQDLSDWEGLEAELEHWPGLQVERVNILPDGAFQHPKSRRAGR